MRTRHRLILSLGLLWLTVGTTPTAVTAAENVSAITNQMCPVLTDEPIDPQISVMYEGNQVYFCCRKCRRQFEQSPQKYLNALPQFATAGLTAGHEHGDVSAADRHDHEHDHATDHGDTRGLDRLVQFAGKFHPLTVHFPIALLVMALVAELCFLLSGATWLSGAARFAVLTGAASAVVAAALGWANAAFVAYSGEPANTLAWHRWLGVATVVVSVVAAGLSEAARRSQTPTLRRLYLGALLASAVLVGWTGHFGGTLVFGPDYFTW